MDKSIRTTMSDSAKVANDLNRYAKVTGKYEHSQPTVQNERNAHHQSRTRGSVGLAFL